MSASEQGYASSAFGALAWGAESTPYTKSSDPTDYFGLFTDEVELPNENPHTPLPGGTEDRRGPHVNSADPKNYEFEIPFVVLDDNAPLEYALGERTVTAVDVDGDGAADYDEHLFTERPKLPTFTLQHQHSELDFIEWFVGTKADLTLSASTGDELEASMNVMAASKQYDDAPASGDFASLGTPTKQPFKFYMKGDVTVGNDVLATVSGFDLSWSNGLEVNHHGNGRDGYSVKETTAAEKYDMSLTATIEDLSMYKRVADNAAPVDVEIPLYRDDGPEYTDALIVRLKNATLVDAPMPNPAEGDLEHEIGILPTNTEIEIRTPVN